MVYHHHNQLIVATSCHDVVAPKFKAPPPANIVLRIPYTVQTVRSCYSYSNIQTVVWTCLRKMHNSRSPPGTYNKQRRRNATCCALLTLGDHIRPLLAFGKRYFELMKLMLHTQLGGSHTFWQNNTAYTRMSLG
jgi:hypothetical protein